MSNTLKYIKISSPFITALVLIPINLFMKGVIVPNTVITDNQGVLISLTIILLSVLIGILGLLTFKSMVWYIKLLVIVLYVPAVVFSLLISGM